MLIFDVASFICLILVYLSSRVCICWCASFFHWYVCLILYQAQLILVITALKYVLIYSRENLPSSLFFFQKLNIFMYISQIEFWLFEEKECVLFMYLLLPLSFWPVQCLIQLIFIQCVDWILQILSFYFYTCVLNTQIHFCTLGSLIFSLIFKGVS